MCDKCTELDRKIEHYRSLLSRVTDKMALDGIAGLIAELLATRHTVILRWLPSRRNNEWHRNMRGYSEFSEPKNGDAGALSGWRVIALCGLYAFLGAIAAAIAAVIGTLPHWI